MLILGASILDENAPAPYRSAARVGRAPVSECKMQQGDMNREIGRRIRLARENHAGISREEMARRLGISRPSVANIENGNQNVTVYQVFEFAERLGVDPFALIPFPQKEAGSRNLSDLLPANADAKLREWVDAL